MYLLILLADILLAVAFVMQKKYQNIAGTSISSTLVYNALLGFAGAIVCLLMKNFKISISLYSVVMAMLFTIFVLFYVFVGFKIIEKSNISFYTLFLMSGGMIVPYIWGVAFFNEELTIARIIGLIAILFAIIMCNSGAKKPEKRTLLLGIAVFFLNGFVSVVSKTHQISKVSEYVSSLDFAFLTNVVKAIVCVGLIVVFRKSMSGKLFEKKPGKNFLMIIITASLANSLSFIFQLVGATTLPATVLYPLVTGGSIILTSLAGVIVFKEKLNVKQWVGISICFIGTLLFL